MRLTDYERAALRDLDRWQGGDPSPIMQLVGLAMKPVDWAVDKVVPHAMMEQASDAIEKSLDVLAEGSQWTFQTDTILRDLRAKGLEAATIDDLRAAPMDVLDAYARGLFAENTLLARSKAAAPGSAARC